MRKITEQSITAIAPNAAAAANGRKLSSGGSFLKLWRSEDDTFYMGECKGSGKNPYTTSADFIAEDHPVYRCSCPSRQFPCKHCLGLLYEMMSGKNFEICEIPEDIVKKRDKLAAKSAPPKSPEEMTPEEAEKAAKKKASAAKSASKAKAKKLEKQLEGLDLVEKAVKELMAAGLGTMGGTSLKTYQDISKQLGDYYLVGPQRLFNRLIIEITEYQKDNKESHYDNAIDTLEKLYSLLKKSRRYINEKLESDDVSNDDTILYEELGGAWKITELEAIGKCKKNARMTQLSFWVNFDEARKEYIDTGVWCDLEDGNVYLTKNYRPLKSLKYVKADDSLFGVMNVPSMAIYPGEGNVRVRWDGAEFGELTAEDYGKLRGFAAKSVSGEAKAIKNTLKDAIANPVVFKTVAFSKIGQTDEGAVLVSKENDTILLEDFPEIEGTVDRLYILPNKDYLKDGVMLCGFFYNAEKRRLCAQPLCIIPDGIDSVIRLLY
ncbi:MAG: SWIM zinc finger family protein [Oscillospiraceae bacterium]|nr:SWIM zinc finger family protein [Oscillospiraceae bacterium]